MHQPRKRRAGQLSSGHYRLQGYRYPDYYVHDNLRSHLIYSTYKILSAHTVQYTCSTAFRGATSYIQVSTENSQIVVQQIPERSIDSSQEEKSSLVLHSSQGQEYEAVVEVSLIRPVRST